MKLVTFQSPLKGPEDEIDGKDRSHRLDRKMEFMLLLSLLKTQLSNCPHQQLLAQELSRPHPLLKPELSSANDFVYLVLVLK